jgi:hypothetical protein
VGSYREGRTYGAHMERGAETGGAVRNRWAKLSEKWRQRLVLGMHEVGAKSRWPGGPQPVLSAGGPNCSKWAGPS